MVTRHTYMVTRHTYMANRRQASITLVSDTSDWWLFKCMLNGVSAGLILDTLCVRYPRAVPFLNFI